MKNRGNAEGTDLRRPLLRETNPSEGFSWSANLAQSACEEIVRKAASGSWELITDRGPTRVVLLLHRQLRVLVLFLGDGRRGVEQNREAILAVRAGLP